jgi:ketosteroid isomerase-like protein
MRCILPAIAAVAFAAQSPAQQSLIDAERAFAKLGAEVGVRDSFIQWFADEGIGFSPQPHRMKETLMKRPPVTQPLPSILRWAPVWGGISTAGDLGWNTGPTVVEPRSGDASKIRHGLFFSVWKRQPDGQWRVVLDLGGETPKPIAPLDAPFNVVNNPSPPPPDQSSPAAALESLMRAERELLSASNETGIGAAYRSRLAGYARIHRAGAMPIVGRASLDGWTAAQTGRLAGEPLAGDVSRSGDLGYVYGRYQHADSGRTGYFARVWQRTAGGVWLIVVDADSPAG